MIIYSQSQHTIVTDDGTIFFLRIWGKDDENATLVMKGNNIPNGEIILKGYNRPDGEIAFENLAKAMGAYRI